MSEIIVRMTADHIKVKGGEYVQDIVRCKECKNWKWIEWAKEHRCTLRNTAINARADDFCSYGERRTDG